MKGGVSKLDYYDVYTNKYEFSTASAWADAKDAKGFTEYSCSGCKFKMKAEFSASVRKYDRIVYITYDTKFKAMSKCGINAKDIISEHNSKKTKTIKG